MNSTVHLNNIIRSCAILLFLVSFTTPAQAQTNSANDVCIGAPALPAPQNNVVRVTNEEELRDAIKDLRAGTTIAISPGRYNLLNTLSITVDDVTIRGESEDCSSVELIGRGMENQDYGNVGNGFWIKANNTTIANLTVREVFLHTIQIDGNAGSPRIYNVRLVNSGQQFIKANPLDFGKGVDNGVVEYSVMEYTDGPSRVNFENVGTGYTNGVDIHAGSGWRISNNRFSNFHTPDNADHLWNAAVLAWNGARDTITENNIFIDVDRSIAYGLEEKNNDHQGGVIRNNMVVMTPGLYSEARTSAADASILVWDSPGTKVLHNSLLLSGNIPNSIEVRYATRSVEVSNNIADGSVRHRDRKFFLSNGNVTNAKPDWFINPPDGNLRIRPEATRQLIKSRRHREAPVDVDGNARPLGRRVLPGANNPE